MVALPVMPFHSSDSFGYCQTDDAPNDRTFQVSIVTCLLAHGGTQDRNTVFIFYRKKYTTFLPTADLKQPISLFRTHFGIEKVGQVVVKGSMSNTTLSHALVCAATASMMLMPEQVAADGIQTYNSEALVLRFDEPVVPRSACRMPDTASSADQKTNIFTLSGDADHLPVAEWWDQNRLKITFPKGSSCATGYRLSFLPGCDKYLSGKPMPQSSFTFRRPATHLQARRVPGMQAGTFIVFPRDIDGHESHESLNFGTGSGVAYTYRRVKQQNIKGLDIKLYTEDVPAEIVPAQLKHGLPPAAVARLAEQHADWAALTPDSPLPAAVLVQPQRPLPEDTQWELFCEASADKGFISDCLFSFVAHQGLDSHVAVSYNATESAVPTPELSIVFSAPVTEEEARRVFRESVFTVGGVPSSTTAEGTCKSLKTGDKEYRFLLQKMLPPATQDRFGAHRRKEDNGQELPYSYTQPGICCGFTVKVEGPTPLLLDIRLPGDVRAALGQKTAQAQSHRLTINPAWPRIRDAIGTYAHTSGSWGTLPPHTLLPLKGDHKVIVTLDNVSALRATAYRLPVNLLANRFRQVKKALEADPQGEGTVELKCRLERHQRGLHVLQEEQLQELRTELKRHLTARRDPAARRLTAELSGTAERDIAFPPCDSPDCGTTEAVVDLDALCGSSAAPGYYLLRLSSVASPSVRAALAELGLAEDTLDSDRYVLLQVSDLRLSFDGHNESLLLTRLSDGKPVPQANVTIYSYDEDAEDAAPATPSGTAELKDGFVSLQARLTKSALYGILVESGDDCALHYHTVYRDEEQEDCRSVLQTDRELYRPGDEVHVRGIFRRYNEDDATPVSAPKEGTPVVMSVHAPSGKELLRRDILLDAVGAFNEKFTLPTGEEDVTGSYLIRVQSADGWEADTRVQSEIFRRDSFLVDQELEMDPVAPQQFTLRLTATDYNTTPLAGGKVELHFSSPVPLLRLGETTYDAPADGTKRSHEGTIRLTTDAGGKAELRGTFAPLLPTDGGWLRFSGSVANDREEHVKLHAPGKALFPADFSFDYSNDTLTLRDVALNRPLAREQSVHMSLLYTAEEERTTPNGFRFVTAKPDTLLTEKDITVPADCRQGIPLGLRTSAELLSVLRQGLPSNPGLVFRGSDPQGRTVETRFRLPYYRLHTQDQGFADINLDDDTAEAKDGNLLLHIKFLRAGTVCFLISHGKNIAHVLREVQSGQQTVSLPLDGREGLVCVTALLMHPDSAGNFTRAEVHNVTADIPCTAYALRTQLQLPGKPLRPGSALHVTGKVTDKDGKGSPAVVTLFAVDKGMLSLTGFEVENLAANFTLPASTTRFDGDFPFAPESNPMQRQLDMLPGIWRGKEHTESDFMPEKSFEVQAAVATPCMVMPCIDLDNASGAASVAKHNFRAKRRADTGSSWEEEAEETGGEGGGFGAAASAPRLRTDFNPLAFWLGAIETDEEGNFSADIAALPDTLTGYSVYALALGKNGTHFGNAQAEFTVLQELMLSPGAPLFMSTGDTLSLPLSITNAAEQSGTWKVAFSGTGDTQQIRLAPGKSDTLYFNYTASDEGEAALNWTATGQEGAAEDAVQARFPVRYPAPLLKEAHHLVLEAGQELKPAALLAPELAESSRGDMELQLSANPLLHLAGCMDFLLEYPYGCTEQTAGGLLPWLFYDRLAPVSPLMAQTPAPQVHERISKTVTKLLARQRQDGGLSYWEKGDSCGWASAYTALVLTIAKEQGVPVPADKMEALRTYLRSHLAELRKSRHYPDNVSALTLFGIGRALADDALTAEAIELALGREPDRRFACFWHKDTHADLQLIANLRLRPQDKHRFFLQWMRARGHDYRHTTTWRSGWMLIALHEYLRLTPGSQAEATVRLQDGSSLTLGQGVTVLHPQGKPLSAIPCVLKDTAGTVYAVVKAKAKPGQTEYPGITEKGLQITRIYEKKGADGNWREASDFAVGDVVRVTLTCAKAADELEYFVLEDYLPSCMEAINPNIPNQAAGLEWEPWSSFFDHKEYLADRVRGFCTRWGGRDLLNMSYYARVKRAGTATAPPAQAQLMYEPQTYGLSPNKKVNASR